MSEKMKKIADEELENVNGGVNSGSGFFLHVRDCNGSYLALRPEPHWDQYHEFARLWPGYAVFTYGETTNGTGLNGASCFYTYVNYNGIWGWAASSFLY